MECLSASSVPSSPWQGPGVATRAALVRVELGESGSRSPLNGKCNLTQWVCNSECVLYVWHHTLYDFQKLNI